MVIRRPRRSRQYARSENQLKYEQERGGLAMSTGAQQPSATLCFFTGGLLYFKSNSCCFYDVYSRGHTGSRPVRAIGSLWHRHPEEPSRQRPTAGSHSSQTRYAISLSYIDHLEIGGRRRPADSSSGCFHNSLRMSRRTAYFSIVPPQILTLRIPTLTYGSPAYHCGHLNWVATRAFQSAHLPT